MKIMVCSLQAQFHNSSLWILLNSSLKCWIPQDKQHCVSAYDRQPGGLIFSCSLNIRMYFPKAGAPDSQTRLPRLYILSAPSRHFAHLKDHYIFETFLKTAESAELLCV